MRYFLFIILVLACNQPETSFPFKDSSFSFRDTYETKKIKELELKQKSLESFREELSKFEILESNFYYIKNKFMDSNPLFDVPFVTIKVKNGTKKSIAAVRLDAVLTSPGRSVPWLKDDINFEIPGGLEPGEEHTSEIRMNPLSNWGTIKIPRNNVLTVIVEQLKDSEGKILRCTLSNWEKEKLESLRRFHDPKGSESEK